MLHGETGEYNGLVSKDQSVSASYSSEKKSGKGTNHKTLAVSEGATQAAFGESLTDCEHHRLP